MIRNEVLYILEQQKGKLVTGGQLARALGVSRNAIWKTIRILQEEGNEIVSIPNSGYRLMATNDTLFEKGILENITTEFIGRNITLLSSVHSTNQRIKELDTSNVPNGYVVIADEQTNGRGRRRRTFLSPKGEGVYLSILLKLEGMENDIRMLTIGAAVAVSRAIEKVSGIKAEIKWVNDIYSNGKKISGILTEAVITGELQEISSVIVGIGINTGKVPYEIEEIATSIQKQVGMRGIRNRLVAEVLNQFERVYLDYIERGEKRRVIEYYKNRLFITGEQVLIVNINHSYPATVLGIDEMGALIVKANSGEVKKVTTGEIKLERGSEK